MHRANHFQLYKALALLLSLSLILTAVFGGTLAQVITKTPSFINTFLSGLDPTGDLVIRKELSHPFGSGYTVPDGLTFDFTVSLGADYAGKTIETSRGDMTADENGNITVSITPNEAVRIKDLMDGTSATITEAAKEAFTPEGGAEKSITIQSGDNTVTYTNAYTPGPVNPVNVTVSGTKLLEGRDWQVGDSFTFLLEYKLAGAEAEWQELGTASVTYELAEVTDPETGEITMEPKPDFDRFRFTELVQGLTYDTAGKYSFRVSEVDGTIGGITYDRVVSYFDVTVGDADMNGSLEIQGVAGYQNATASYDASTNQYHVDVTVNNIYAPAGTATADIHIDKRVMSMSGEDKSPAGYTFELYDESGTLVAISGETSAAGETSIELTFDAKDAGSTFHYTLKETHSGETHDGLFYDDAAYGITVTVVDDLDGTISACIYDTEDYKTELVPVEPEETEPEQTEPTETAPATSEPVVEIVTEPAPPASGVDTTEAAEETQPIAPQEDTNTPAEDIEDSTTPTIHNETDTPVVTVFLPEAKEVAVIPEGASNSHSVSFVNVYDPTDTAASFSGTKELNGRSLNEGEFAFDLYATGDSFTVADGMEPIQTVSNDAEGNFSFASISFSKVGTYCYVVKENASAKMGGITYDDSLFHVIVTITDENGVLKAATVTTDELGDSTNIKFVNSYHAAATSVTFTGTKVLNGTDLTTDMFQFHLYKADANYNVQGAVLAEASNDASGSFTFGNITCSEPGIFYYVVTEDDSACVEGMTYDDTTYGIKVNVWDDGSGMLKASYAISVVGGGEVGAMIFENSYTKPVDPPKPTEPSDPSEPTDSSDPTDPSMPTDPSDPTKPTDSSDPTDPSKPTDPAKPTTPVDPDVPPTGDNNPTGLYIVLAAISIVAIILLLVTGKKPKGRYLRK